VKTLFEEIIGAIFRETFSYAAEKLWRRWSDAQNMREHTLTCSVCGRKRIVRGVQVVRWKENPRKPRRCKTCRAMTQHSLSIW